MGIQHIYHRNKSHLKVNKNHFCFLLKDKKNNKNAFLKKKIQFDIFLKRKIQFFCFILERNDHHDYEKQETKELLEKINYKNPFSQDLEKLKREYEKLIEKMKEKVDKILI